MTKFSDDFNVPSLNRIGSPPGRERGDGGTGTVEEKIMQRSRGRVVEFGEKFGGGGVGWGGRGESYLTKVKKRAGKWRRETTRERRV